MSSYYYGNSVHKHRRFVSQTKRIVAVCFGLLLLIGAFIMADTWRQQILKAPATSKVEITASDRPANISATPYFTFSSYRNWLQITNESTTNRYIFRSFMGPLVEREVIIYTNQVPDDIFVTRVVPVQIKNGRALKLDGTVSKPCSQIVSPSEKSKITTVTWLRTSFPCNGDSAVYSVLAGVVGGDHRIGLQRANGETMAYSLAYRDLTTQPDIKPFTEIVDTFEAR